MVSTRNTRVLVERSDSFRVFMMLGLRLGGSLDKGGAAGAVLCAADRLAAQKESDYRNTKAREQQYSRAPCAGDAQVRDYGDPYTKHDNSHLFGHTRSLLCFYYYDKLAALLVGS